ncbi:hypothetical protein [Lysinibacillus sp. LZ02]|uniref:hypothetical protein n=1 Tax=Lysinibacillus sp. LZ02 TaxID=3420668 RepID=UPI003D36C153
MYRTIEERLQALEKQIARQDFQIQLLQNLAANHQKYAIYQYVISTNMDEHTFYLLQQLTKDYEEKLNLGESFTLHEFVTAVKKVLSREGIYLTNVELSDFVPKWLGGTLGSIGFSLPLHDYFYEKE